MNVALYRIYWCKPPGRPRLARSQRPPLVSWPVRTAIATPITAATGSCTPSVRSVVGLYVPGPGAGW
jgi:hypothetical protein